MAKRKGPSRAMELSAKSRKPVALVVDDEEPCLGMLRALLGMYGFRVLTAGNGAAALRICGRLSLPVDIVVTDVQMPDMSGVVLAERIEELRPHMPILFMSGGVGQEFPSRSRLGAARGFLAKPFSIQALLATIEGLRHGPPVAA